MYDKRRGGPANPLREEAKATDFDMRPLFKPRLLPDIGISPTLTSQSQLTNPNQVFRLKMVLRGDSWWAVVPVQEVQFDSDP